MPPIYAINMDSTSEVEPSDEEEEEEGPFESDSGSESGSGDAESDHVADEIDAQIHDTRTLLEEHEKKIESLSGLLVTAVRQRDEQKRLLEKLQGDRAALNGQDNSAFSPPADAGTAWGFAETPGPSRVKFFERYMGAVTRRHLRRKSTTRSLMVKLQYRVPVDFSEDSDSQDEVPGGGGGKAIDEDAVETEVGIPQSLPKRTPARKRARMGSVVDGDPFPLNSILKSTKSTPAGKRGRPRRVDTVLNTTQGSVELMPVRNSDGSQPIIYGDNSMLDSMQISTKALPAEKQAITRVSAQRKGVPREELDPRYHETAISEVNGVLMAPHACKTCTEIRQFCDRKQPQCGRCEGKGAQCISAGPLTVARRRAFKRGAIIREESISLESDSETNESIDQDGDTAMEETGAATQDAEVLSISDDTTLEVSSDSEYRYDRTFKCPIIGCEMDYPSDAALKYHREHAHPNDQLLISNSVALSTPSQGPLMASDGKTYEYSVVGCSNVYTETSQLEHHHQYDHSHMQLNRALTASVPTTSMAPTPAMAPTPIMAPTPDSQATSSAVLTENVLDPNPLQTISLSSPQPIPQSSVPETRLDDRYDKSVVQWLDGAWKVPYLCTECKEIRQFCDRKQPTCTRCQIRGKTCIPTREGLQMARPRITKQISGVRQAPRKRKLIVSLKVKGNNNRASARDSMAPIALMESSQSQSPYQDIVPDAQEQDWASMYYESLPQTYAEDSLLSSAFSWITNESTT